MDSLCVWEKKGMVDSKKRRRKLEWPSTEDTPVRTQWYVLPSSRCAMTDDEQQLQAWERTFTEPLAEYTQFSSIIKQLLKYRHMKHVQYEMTRELLDAKRMSLEDLERSEAEAQRLEKALERVRIVNDDGGIERALPKKPVDGAEEVAPPVVPQSPTSTPAVPRKSGGSGLLSALTHTFHGIVDNDPESTRRNSIGRTRESIHEVSRFLHWRSFR